VSLYETEHQVYDCFYRFIFPENTDKQLAQFNSEFSALSEAENLAMHVA